MPRPFALGLIVLSAVPLAAAGPRTGLLAPEVAAVVIQGDFESARAAIVSATVPGAESLAKWCQRKKLYAARDNTYELILLLEPDHGDARKGLRYQKQRGGGWRQSDQYRRPENKNDAALPEFDDRRAELYGPLAEFAFEWLERGSSAAPIERAQELAAIVTLAAPDESDWPTRLAAVWDTALRTWVAAPGRGGDTADVERAGAPAPAAQAFPDLELELRLDSFGARLFEHRDSVTSPASAQGSVSAPGSSPARLGRWVGQWGARTLDVTFVHEAARARPMAESEDAAERWERPWSERGALHWPGFYFATFERASDPPGAALGASPYATLLSGPMKESLARHDVPGTAFVASGLVRDGAWSVLLECTPAPTPTEAVALFACLRDVVRYSGPKRVPEWTDEEVRARWRAWAPNGLDDEMKDIVRTEHFVILGNSASGKKFAQKMEECYARVRELYPFDEIAGQRLLPVFLLRTPEQYYEFLSKNAGYTLEEASRSAGVAWADLYATWYEAPGDTVHLHEATHQLFRNRLRLSGGGSWFQEGVAEYAATRSNERGGAARMVKKRQHTPLREFMQIRSLLWSGGEQASKRGSAIEDHYALAGLLIEFLRESDFAKDRFQDFIRTVGRLPANDVDRIEAAVSSLYGCGLEELEEAWIAYCQRR